MRNLFSPPATRLYPTREKEPHRAARSRGRIEIDIEVCIFCSACAKRCPTDALIVSKSDKEWNIDRLRCCTCNACVEVCPKKCLSMGNRTPLPRSPGTRTFSGSRRSHCRRPSDHGWTREEKTASRIPTIPPTTAPFTRMYWRSFHTASSIRPTNSRSSVFFRSPAR